MKVLSFDVGIKNLGICLIEYNDEEINIKSKLNIHYWDIINLISNEEQKIINKCLKQNCNIKPKSYIEFNNNKYYICSKHLSNINELIEPILSPWNEDKWCQIKNEKCSHCNETKPKQSLYKNTDLNLILCSRHYKSCLTKKNNCISKINTIKNKKVKECSSNDIKLQLIKSLDERKEKLLQIADIVLIENQPTFKNPSMKAISDTIYTWFMIRALVDGDTNNSTIKELKFISPSNKLKEFNTNKLDEADDNKKYKITKKLSINNTETILTLYNLNTWIEHLSSFKKKDDLADSFLQGWYVLNNNYKNKLYEELEGSYIKNIIKIDDI
jgi:hypothetical protein